MRINKYNDICLSGLTKKEFSRILLHPSPLMLRMGILYLTVILDKIAQIISMGKHNARFQTLLGTAIVQALPDYHSIVTLRLRYGVIHNIFILY